MPYAIISWDFYILLDTINFYTTLTGTVSTDDAIVAFTSGNRLCSKSVTFSRCIWPPPFQIPELSLESRLWWLRTTMLVSAAISWPPLSMTRSKIIVVFVGAFAFLALLGSYKQTQLFLHDRDADDGVVMDASNETTVLASSDAAVDFLAIESSLANSSYVDDAQEINVEESRRASFYILDLPEATSQLVETFATEISDFYTSALNEDAGEVWIHRGFEQHPDRTMNESEADVILVPAYLHFNARRRAIYDKSKPEGEDVSSSVPFTREELASMMRSRMRTPSKPHVLLTPTANPEISRRIGLTVVTNELNDVNLYSVGYERNPAWQRVNPDRIIPVPYVVKPDLPRDQFHEKLEAPRTRDFVFYAGDTRPHANKWAGCDRQMLAPLRERTDMDVRIVNKKNRLSQTEYNHRMDSSEFCLLVCGDTPTSRSLASSMVAGCIPLRIGSRLRGQCERPCHRGFGWTITGLSHLPYEHLIDWTLFPEVDEQAFVNDPNAVLDAALASISDEQRQQMRDVMNTSQLAFTYGWGDPVTSTEFGDAVPWIWESIQRHLGLPATAAIATTT